MNLVSMWCVRISLALFLVPRMGLHGYWTAMALELCFRGLIFLIRLYRGKWCQNDLWGTLSPDGDKVPQRSLTTEEKE